MSDAEKSEMKGIRFVQPLEFGDWPIEKVEEVITTIRNKYSNFDEFELLGVDRGGYSKCQGHEECDELMPTYGTITFIRKGIRQVTTYESV